MGASWLKRFHPPTRLQQTLESLQWQFRNTNQKIIRVNLSRNARKSQTSFHFPIVLRLFFKVYFRKPSKIKLPFWQYPNFKLTHNFSLQLQRVSYLFLLILNFLSFQVALQLEELINKHQRIPGSILKALLDRIPFKRKSNQMKIS